MHLGSAKSGRQFSAVSLGPKTMVYRDFIAQHGADSVRITFEDYGFFIPTDSGGKTVTLAGNFSRKTVSKEETEHIAEDLGEEPPENVPEFQYSIVATGISIPRS